MTSEQTPFKTSRLGKNEPSVVVLLKQTLSMIPSSIDQYISLPMRYGRGMRTLHQSRLFRVVGESAAG